MHVDEVMFEVTRKCNLKCGHCMRGCAQDENMSPEVIQEFLSHVGSIGTLMIGGGEPSLAIEVIEEIRYQLAFNGVEVENVFLVTNGKTVSKKLLQVFDDIYGMCTSNDISGFAISNDEYHINERGFYRDLSGYKYLIDEYDEEDDTFAISYITENVIHEHTNRQSGNWFARGRAKNWGKNKSEYLDNLKINDFDNPTYIGGQMYVCFDGDVLGDANMPYTDMKKHAVGNVMHWDKLIEGIKKSTVRNHEWCRVNCEYSTPEMDPTDGRDTCCEWRYFENACREIEKIKRIPVAV